jgi:transcriptional regulator with PAS, ATPase and Fis domain
MGPGTGNGSVDSGSGWYWPSKLELLEKWAIGEALKRSGGNKTRAAKMLGIDPDSLARKMEKYGFTAKE